MNDATTMTMQSAVYRLNNLLPLKARQNQLSPALKALHQALLVSLAQQGVSLTPAQIAAHVGQHGVAEALQLLGKLDLV